MSKKPNILFFFTDMQRADTIAALGNQQIKTPNFDRLVKEGVAFSEAFTPSPVCCPARCSLHYGLYTGKTGLADNAAWMEDNGASYPDLLKRAGYSTHAIGKCHFEPNEKSERRGFDTRLVQEEVCSDPSKDDYVAWLAERDMDYNEPHGARGEMYYIPQIATHSGEGHPTTWIADRSIELIRKKEKTDQPWLLFSSVIHPHPPFALPKPWHKCYRPQDMSLPLSTDRDEFSWTYINRIQNRYKWRDQGKDLNLIRLIKAYYYGCISHVDYHLGRILDCLKETGQWDDTMIVFSSDHGEHLGDLNCFGKRSMHDASAKVPLVVRYPDRFAKGQVCDRPVSLVDILPTFTAAAGLDLHGIDHDGIDLASTAKGQMERENVHSHFGHQGGFGASLEHGLYMTVNKSYKYVYSSGDQKEWLFDRKKDPQEISNLAHQSGKQQLLSHMATQTQAFYWNQGVRINIQKDDDGFRWKKTEPFDRSTLDIDPDAGLLFQDHMSEPFHLPDYVD